MCENYLRNTYMTDDSTQNKLPFLVLEFYESDPSKLYVTASNGKFRGQTEAYINAKILSGMCENLTGFPSSDDSVVEYFSSSAESKTNRLALKFQCRDSLGHCAVRVTMRADDLSEKEPDNTSFLLKFEPHALDTFRSSLRTSLDKGEGISKLNGSVNW